MSEEPKQAETKEPENKPEPKKPEISEADILKAKLLEYEAKEKERLAKEKELEETKLKEQNKFKELFEKEKTERETALKELEELRKFKVEYDKKQAQIKSAKIDEIAKEYNYTDEQKKLMEKMDIEQIELLATKPKPQSSNHSADTTPETKKEVIQMAGVPNHQATFFQALTQSPKIK